MSFDDLLDDGQAKAGSFLLCGKKRIKYPLQIIFADAAAGIFDLHHARVACILNIDRESPSSFHGLHGVEKDIQECSVEKIVVSLNGERPAVKSMRDHHPFLFQLWAEKG